jgi:hypothetical protein
MAASGGDRTHIRPGRAPNIQIDALTAASLPGEADRHGGNRSTATKHVQVDKRGLARPGARGAPSDVAGRRALATPRPAW